MKIGVTGYKGRLGSTIIKYSDYLRGEVVPLKCNITQREQIEKEINQIQPDVILNCAAYTDVNGAEFDPDSAYAVNFEGIENILAHFSGRIINFSTDFVFDGRKGRYKETDDPNPLNVYAFSKLGGELAVETLAEDCLNVRVSALWGSDLKTDRAYKIMNILENKIQTEMFSNIYSNYTNVAHLVKHNLQKMIDLDKNIHLLHYADFGKYSRYEFAREFEHWGKFDKNILFPLKIHPQDLDVSRPKDSTFNLGLAKKCGLSLMYTGELVKEWYEHKS